jgi:hypothetical protein
MSKGRKYFLDEILQTTQAAYTQIQLSKEKNQEKYVKKMQSDIDNLSKRIMFRWKMKVRKSALKGRTNAYIYFLKSQYDQFLLKGTQREGEKHFHREGLRSVLDNIRDEIRQEGFEVEAKFVTKFGYVVEITWGHHFENGNEVGRAKLLRPKRNNQFEQ